MSIELPTRRSFFRRAGAGFAGLALIDLLSRDGFFAQSVGQRDPAGSLRSPAGLERMRTASFWAAPRTSGEFMKASDCVGTVVTLRSPMLCNASGTSNICRNGIGWLRLTVR